MITDEEENEMSEAQSRVLAGSTAGLGQIRPQSLTERLEDEQKRLQERCDEITLVLDSLHKNPETQSILDAVARLGHLNY